ncbi:unnamed protein product, partial [Closterium sp. Naga37s-1]
MNPVTSPSLPSGRPGLWTASAAAARGEAQGGGGAAKRVRWEEEEVACGTEHTVVYLLLQSGRLSPRGLATLACLCRSFRHVRRSLGDGSWGNVRQGEEGKGLKGGEGAGKGGDGEVGKRGEGEKGVSGGGWGRVGCEVKRMWWEEEQVACGTEQSSTLLTPCTALVRGYAVPPHAVPSHAVPSHAVPPHAVPSHAVPSHAVPSHAVPSHAVPSHAVPSHAVPSHAVPPHAVPSHAVPSHAVPSHAVPSHAVPPHAVPSHAVPSHAVPSHAVPSHAVPSHAVPSHAVPSHAVPPHAACEDEMLWHLVCIVHWPSLNAPDLEARIRASGGYKRFCRLLHTPCGEVQHTIPACHVDEFVSDVIFLVDVSYRGSPIFSRRITGAGDLEHLQQPESFVFRLPDMDVGTVLVDGKPGLSRRALERAARELQVSCLALRGRDDSFAVLLMATTAQHSTIGG